MANTLTNLLPDAYAALDVVSRELVGFIPGVTRDASVDAAAINQDVRVAITPKNVGGRDNTAAMSIPSEANQTITNTAIKITKSRAFPFSWSGEERLAMDKGPGFQSLKRDQVAQAFRAAVNEIEADLYAAAAAGASRAYGAVSTVPFGSTNKLGESAQVRKILDDNGAPPTGRSLVISTTAGANLRSLLQLTNVNEAGTSVTLRDGELLNVHGFSIRESGLISTISAGTGATVSTNSVGYAVGSTSITLKAAGTGTILVGDIITINGDTGNQYVVTKGAAAVSGATIEIAAPGLRKAIPASEKSVTLVADGARNIAYSQNAIVLASRLPALPEEGDLAIEREVITDPRSGLSFYLEVYPGYRMNLYQVTCAWGVAAIKPEHIALLLE